MPSNHLILCRPLLLPSIFPSIRVFSSESALDIRWSKYCSFSFIISPSDGHPGLAFEDKPSRCFSPGPWAVPTVPLCSGLERSLATYWCCGTGGVCRIWHATLFSFVTWRKTHHPPHRVAVRTVWVSIKYWSSAGSMVIDRSYDICLLTQYILSVNNTQLLLNSTRSPAQGPVVT